MKLSTKGRYAMVALTDLALAGGDGLVTLAELSRRQNVSLPYLEQLFVKLRRSGLVASVRGPGGGYRLARSAAEIRVADVLAAVVEIASGQRMDDYLHDNVFAPLGMTQTNYLPDSSSDNRKAPTRCLFKMLLSPLQPFWPCSACGI